MTNSSTISHHVTCFNSHNPNSYVWSLRGTPYFSCLSQLRHKPLLNIQVLISLTSFTKMVLHHLQFILRNKWRICSKNVDLLCWRKSHQLNPVSLESLTPRGQFKTWISTILICSVFSRLTLPWIVVVPSKNIASNLNNGNSGSFVIAMVVEGSWSPAMTTGPITQFPVTSVQTLQVRKKPGA